MGKHIDIHQRLIDGCRRQDRQSQAELYRLYSRGMYHVSLRIVKRREDAEDILQESFVRAFQRIDSFRSEGSFGAWLKRIVINRSLNHVRDRMRFSEMDEDSSGGEWAAEEETDEEEYTIDDIKEAMMALPVGYRTIFSLYLFEGYSHQEVSEMLHISVNTSKSQLSRAKQRLKEEMKALRNERRQA